MLHQNALNGFQVQPYRDNSIVGLLANKAREYLRGNQTQTQPQSQNVFAQTQPSPVQQQGSGVVMQDTNPPVALPPRTTPNKDIGFDSKGQPVLSENYGSEAAEPADFFTRSGREQEKKNRK